MDDRVFKSSGGVYLTKQLFFEMAEPPRENVLYTLKHEDHAGYPSFRRLYLELDDETEYTVATTLFAGWPHFKKLLTCTWFLDYLSEIREELKVRSACERIKTLTAKARSGDVKTNQYLLDKILKDDKSPVGRPTKARIKEEANRLFQEQSDINADYQRLFQ